MEPAITVEAGGGRSRVARTRRLLDETAVLIGLVVVFGLFGALIGPQFFRAANLELIARQTVIVCVAALGMTMVIVSGGIGVGLCEYVPHLAMFDYIGISGTMEGRVIEYVDHLHELFENPVVIRGGRYMPPLQPAYSIAIREKSRIEHRYPDERVWA